jgi:hypothetical protein
MATLLIENDSSDSLSIIYNQQPAVVLAPSSASSSVFNVKRGDVIQLSNSVGKVELDAYAVFSDYKNLSVIDDANNKYKDFSTSQPLGTNIQKVDWRK